MERSRHVWAMSANGRNLKAGAFPRSIGASPNSATLKQETAKRRPPTPGVPAQPSRDGIHLTIRAALFRLLFWTLLGTVLVVGALSFYQFRAALRTEIAANLRFGASTVMQRIDTKREVQDQMLEAMKASRAA